jgi:hypothetical protein
MSAQTRLTLVMVADVAREGVEAFQRYEAAVLPMLERHDGRLERRLRTADGQAEVHIVSFGSRAGYDAYIADPERADHRTLPDVPAVEPVSDATDVPLTATPGHDRKGIPCGTLATGCLARPSVAVAGSLPYAASAWRGGRPALGVV